MCQRDGQLETSHNLGIGRMIGVKSDRMVRLRVQPTVNATRLASSNTYDDPHTARCDGCHRRWWGGRRRIKLASIRFPAKVQLRVINSRTITGNIRQMLNGNDSTEGKLVRRYLVVGTMISMFGITGCVWRSDYN